jgi:predicted enzyme related to lactoylglutathione lyase
MASQFPVRTSQGPLIYVTNSCANSTVHEHSEVGAIMPRRFDHIDLRVPRLSEATAFYEKLLPALGFTRRVAVPAWLQFEAEGDGVTEFFCITESSHFSANENRVAFRAESVAAVDALARTIAEAGARNIEGPMVYEAGYYAVFFEDPFGNRFEVCHRDRNAPEIC